MQNATNAIASRAGRQIAAIMALAVLAVFLLAWGDLRREQQRGLEDFTAQQASLAAALATTLEARSSCILQDLRTLASLDDLAARDAAARRLVAAGSIYRRAQVFGPGDRMETDARLDSPAADSGAAALEQAKGSVLAAARLSGSASSPSLPRDADAAGPDGGTSRLFALASGDRVALLVVDGDRLFDGLAKSKSDSAPSRVRLLVVDPTRRWMERDPADATSHGRWRAADEPLPADLSSLLGAMVSGQSGATQLARETAGLLGLDHRLAVAGYAPVASGAGEPWSIAVVASAMVVRDRARVGVWRLGASTALAGLVVGLFGVLVLRAQRRSFGLAEALRLSEATAALRERSERIVAAIPIGVLALDAQMRVTSINPRLATLGLAAGGSLRDTLARSGPERLAELEALVVTARSEGREAARTGLRLEIAPDLLRDFDAYAVPLGAESGECFLVLHDRTETRDLERSLARADKLATIGTLAAGIAHEVGTPLGIISGRAEQLLARLTGTLANRNTGAGEPGSAGEASDPMKKGLTSILAQVDKVSATIRQLLDFARVRAIEAVKVTPAQALGTATALLEHRFRQGKVSLAVDAPALVPAIAGDPGQLEQVFVNLLMNAADACAPGGHVEARAFVRGDRVAFEIADDGCGILQEHLSAVLDPFFTTKKRGQGTGLGLTIAADIVKNHGGALEIDSTPGAGTTVRVLFPIAREGRSKSQ